MYINIRCVLCVAFAPPPRWTRIDRDYDICTAELARMFEPSPARISVAERRPEEFVEEVEMFVERCAERLTPPSTFVRHIYDRDLLRCLQAAGLPVTSIGGRPAEAVKNGAVACVRNVIDEMGKAKGLATARNRSLAYQRAVNLCVAPALKCQYDVAAELGFAQAVGWLRT